MSLRNIRCRHVSQVPPSSGSSGNGAIYQSSVGLTLALFAIVFSLLQVVAYSRKSATWDEPVHLATGYAALAHGDYRVEPTHPPFIRMWAALPLLFMPDVHIDTSVIDRTDPVDWNSGSVAYDFSTRFLYIDNDADRLLNAARFMIVILGVVLGVLVFCWTYEWLGFAPAVWALTFYTLSPNLMAHGSLVTTDIGITCFIFGTVYFAWRMCRHASLFNRGGLTLFFALAVVSKFSALILGPIVACLLTIAVRRRSLRARSAIVMVIVLAAASFISVWAVYRFQYMPSRSPTWVLELEQAPLARTVPGIARVTSWIDGYRLLPNMFTEGFLSFAQSMTPPVPTFLAGAYSDRGWWYYYPAAIFMKTPVPLLALLVIGLLICVRRGRERGWDTEAFVLIPVVSYLVVGIANAYQVGVRHMLPLYPFFIVTAAVGAMALMRRRAGRMALATLVVAWSVVVAAAYPHMLTYFTTLVGGPRNGYRYLADSNIDWGQGLKLLKEWMDGQGVSQIALAYYGTADPAYYGIDYTALPAARPGFALPSIDRPWVKPRLPGYVVVGATVLTGVYHAPHWQLFYRGLRQTKPAAVIGNSMFVYWLDSWPEAAPVVTGGLRNVEIDRWLADELMRGQWFEHAIRHYRSYLEHRPDQAAALINLGTALVTTDALEEAVAILRRGLALAPNSGVGHMALAAALYDMRQDIADVLVHARRAVQLMPSDPGALMTLGRALAANGDLAEAIEFVDRAVAIDPANTDARDLQQRIRTVAGLST